MGQFVAFRPGGDEFGTGIGKAIRMPKSHRPNTDILTANDECYKQHIRTKKG